MAEVRTEISATVVTVHVEAGQAVEVGDELVVLRSMRTDIPVVAPIAGTVSSVAVEPETPVEEGDLVAVIDE
jgi:acetyl-CoA carboxylase biotin carboxyl carrier protein